MRLRCILFSAAILGFALCVGSPTARAQTGAARGNVAIIDAAAKAYGYSAMSQLWTATSLDAAAVERLAGDHLGYVRTPFRIYSFNSTNDHWYWANYTGEPLGASTAGATTIFWTSNSAYAIASLWSTWRIRPWQGGETPRGGGSCGTFALAWTENHAYAFHSASGQWMTQALSEPISGGITCENFGLVWTPSFVYSFNPYPGGWVPLSLGLPEGISVTGDGSVALAWSASHAEAYSALFDSWFPFDSASPLLGGAASGNLALLWSAAGASVFDVNTGEWSGVQIDTGGPGGDKPPDEIDQHFRIHPNPASSDRLQLSLPGDQEWTVEVFDVGGRQVQSLRAQRSGVTTTLDWDRTDGQGRRLAAGTYWMRARSPKAVEVRRVLLLN